MIDIRFERGLIGWFLVGVTMVVLIVALLRTIQPGLDHQAPQEIERLEIEIPNPQEAGL
jgi:hypothetical protein